MPTLDATRPKYPTNAGSQSGWRLFHARILYPDRHLRLSPLPIVSAAHYQRPCAELNSSQFDELPIDKTIVKLR